MHANPRARRMRVRGGHRSSPTQETGKQRGQQHEGGLEEALLLFKDHLLRFTWNFYDFKSAHVRGHVEKQDCNPILKSMSWFCRNCPLSYFYFFTMVFALDGTFKQTAASEVGWEDRTRAKREAVSY